MMLSNMRLEARLAHGAEMSCARRPSGFSITGPLTDLERPDHSSRRAAFSFAAHVLTFASLG